MESNHPKAGLASALSIQLVAALVFPILAEASDDWVFVGPETPPERIKDVASDGDGTYVAVGDNSVVYWSPNGDNWLYLPLRGLHGNVRDVLHERGTWVMVTDKGEIGVSLNGREWEIESFADASFAKVFRFDDVYYAIGQEHMAISSDGANWALADEPLIPDMGQVAEATVVGDKVVVVTASQENSLTTDLTVYSSSNLIEWNESTTWVYAQNFDAIRFAGIKGMGVVTYNYNDMYISQDMTTWEKVHDPTQENANLSNSGYLENAFVYNERIVFFVRPQINENGVNAPSPTGNYFSLDANAVFNEESFNYIAESTAGDGYQPTKPVFAAGDRLYIASELGSLYGSTDFLDWTLLFKGNPDDIVDIAKTDTGIAALTEKGELLLSDNAVDWKRIGPIVEGEAFELDYNSGQFLVADGYLDGYFLGRGGTVESVRNRYDRLSYSSDGENWKSVHVSIGQSGGSSESEPMTFDAFALGEGATLAISMEGEIYRSENLEEWETLASAFPDADFAAEPCPCDNKRFGIELYYFDGEFWARSIEGQAVLISGSYLPLFSKWYRSDDFGESWSFEGNEKPPAIASSELGQWPRPNPDQEPTNQPGEYESKTLYAFGRYIRVGENYRIELSETLESADHSRLVNLSLRAYTGDNASTLIAGFVIIGSGSTNSDTGDVLLRGIGPSLAEVAPSLEESLAPDPRLRLYKGQDLLLEEDGIGLENAAAAFDAVGAFQLAANPLDAALLSSNGQGLFTVHVQDDTGGIALAEIYRMPDSDFELVNLSGRAFVSDGDMTCIGGFVIEGETVRTILIRGVGEGLGIGGELADPRITVYRGDEIIASNDDWAGAHLQDFAEQAGAFPLEPGSKDAALVLPLAPSLYTVHLSSKPGDSGVALLEIYDLGD